MIGLNTVLATPDAEMKLFEVEKSIGKNSQITMMRLWIHFQKAIPFFLPSLDPRTRTLEEICLMDAPFILFKRLKTILYSLGKTSLPDVGGVFRAQSQKQ